jgi:hypothetical protein
MSPRLIEVLCHATHICMHTATDHDPTCVADQTATACTDEGRLAAQPQGRHMHGGMRQSCIGISKGAWLGMSACDHQASAEQVLTNANCTSAHRMVMAGW